MANAKDNRTRAEPVASRPDMPEYDLLAPDAGRGLLPWQWAEERLLATMRYWLATTRPNGHPSRNGGVGCLGRCGFLF